MNDAPRTVEPAALATRPVFLVGAERSGTTLLRLMLEHHPQLAFRNEFEFAVDQIGEDGSWPDTKAYADWLATHRIFLSSGFTLNESLAYPDLCRDFLEQHRAMHNKERVGATVHRHFDRVLLIWPDARFIHLVRDPRDVASSNIGMGWAGNVWHGAARWVEAERLWDALSARLAPEDTITVAYEDLVAEPEQTLTKLCAFMGLGYSPSMLDYPEDSTYDFPDPKLRNQWRKKLSSREIQLVESRVGDLLEARGYERSPQPPLPPNALERLRLDIQDWRYRKSSGIKKFGWRLTLLKAFAKRLRLRDLERKVDLERHEITTRYLK